MKISISPVNIWTSSGPVSANQFEVRYVNYSSAGTAVADCHLWAGSTEVGSQLVTATAQQTAAWEDDASFFAVLAQNAGLTPA